MFSALLCDVHSAQRQRLRPANPLLWPQQPRAQVQYDLALLAAAWRRVSLCRSVDGHGFEDAVLVVRRVDGPDHLLFGRQRGNLAGLCLQHAGFDLGMQVVVTLDVVQLPLEFLRLLFQGRPSAAKRWYAHENERGGSADCELHPFLVDWAGDALAGHDGRLPRLVRVCTERKAGEGT
jgi:hypothetical protein